MAERHWVVPHGAAWLDVYRLSVYAPERAKQLLALRRLAPFTTALDLGCHCGVLMPLLQAASPDVTVTGVDLSAEALALARQVYPTHTWVEASFVDWLPMYAKTGRQFEVVCASSALGHLDPADADATLAALMQVAKRALLIQAQAVLPGFPEGRVDSSGVFEWRYDYVRRLTSAGWRVTTAHWQQVHGPQPNALLVFER